MTDDLTRRFPPGDILREELKERGVSRADFAWAIGQPVALVDEFIAGELALTPEFAQQLASALGTSPQFWLNLEKSYRDAPDSSDSET